MDDDLETRDVVAVPRTLGQTEEADELGRHHVGRRHAVPLDHGQRTFGVELAHDGEALAHVERAEIETLTAAVVHSRRDQVDAVVRKELECVAETLGSVSRHGRVHLGRTSGARRPWAVPWFPTSRRWGCPDADRRVRSEADPRRTTRICSHPGIAPTDRDTLPDGAGTGQPVGPVGVVGMEHDGRRAGMIDDPLDLRPRQRRVQRDGLEASLLCRQEPDDDVGVVGQGEGEDVARSETWARSAWTSWWARPASSPKDSVRPEGDATMAGISGRSSAMYQNPSRWSQGCFIRNRVYR